MNNLLDLRVNGRGSLVRNHVDGCVEGNDALWWVATCKLWALGGEGRKSLMAGTDHIMAGTCLGNMILIPPVNIYCRAR